MLLIVHGKVTAITAYVEMFFARLPKLVYGHVYYRICSRNLRSFFPPILAVEKAGCVKYADFF